MKGNKTKPKGVPWSARSRDSSVCGHREMIQSYSGHITLICGATPTVADLEHLQRYLRLRIKTQREWERDEPISPDAAAVPDEHAKASEHD